MNTSLAEFVKEKRKQLKLTQPELAEKAGVGLRFLRELENGKESVRLDKVNQVLALFGASVGVIKIMKHEKRKRLLQKLFGRNYYRK
jgi:y4mF family transcriptional regulator